MNEGWDKPSSQRIEMTEIRVVELQGLINCSQHLSCIEPRIRKKGKVVFLDSVNIIQGTHDDKRNPKHDCLEQSRPNGCPYTKS